MIDFKYEYPIIENEILTHINPREEIFDAIGIIGGSTVRCWVIFPETFLQRLKLLHPIGNTNVVNGHVCIGTNVMTWKIENTTFITSIGGKHWCDRMLDLYDYYSPNDKSYNVLSTILYEISLKFSSSLLLQFMIDNITEDVVYGSPLTFHNS